MIEQLLALFCTYFIRIVICIGLIKPLRVLLGYSGTLILALAISFFEFQCFVDLSNPINQINNFHIVIAKEVMTGTILGLLISLTFEVIPFVGRLIDTFRGSQFSEQFAPELGSRDSELEMYAGLLVPAVFFAGPYFVNFILLLGNNLNIISFASEAKNLFSLDFISRLVQIIFEISIFIVFPLVLLTLTLEITLSIFYKLIPKLQLGSELTLIKSGIGIMFLAVVLSNGPHLLNVINSSLVKIILQRK